MAVYLTEGNDTYEWYGDNGDGSPPGEIYGLGGNDVIVGDAGNDYIDGGDGNDILNPAVLDPPNTDAGDDTLLGRAGDDLLTGDRGNDTLIGHSGNDRMYGGDDNDIIWAYEGVDDAQGGDGNDTIYSDGGGDRLSGGVGDDTYNISGDGNVLFLPQDTGYDRVFSLVSFSLEGCEIEDLFLTGFDSINGRGNHFNNAVNGNSGHNVLNGLGGNDGLFGYDGNDTLDGGSGTDEMYGGPGNDTYYIDSAFDQTVENDNAGTDTIISSISLVLTDRPNLENLTLIGSASYATGNGLWNTITGNGFANELNGLAGYDTGTAAADADDRVIYNPNTGELSYDADGLGGIAAVRFAVLDNLPNLASTQFFVA